MFSDVPPARPLIEAGKMRALGVTTAERVQALPDIPPLAEVGMPNYNTASWHSISTAARRAEGDRRQARAAKSAPSWASQRCRSC